MIYTALADYDAPLSGMTPGARAQLVAVTDDHATAHALAHVAERPVVVELPTANPYGLYRVFSLHVPSRARCSA